MHTLTHIRPASGDFELGMSQNGNRRWLESRLPRRSLRQVFAIPLSDHCQSSIFEREAELSHFQQLGNDRPRVDVATIPSPDRTCRHHLFVEDGTYLRKFELPATSSVVVSQRFDARAGDTLNYDYVVLLNASGRFAADRPAVRAVLVDRRTESAVSLMNRSLSGCSATYGGRTRLSFRESQSITVPATGQYELRFITFIDGNFPGSDAHLLVNSVRLLDRSRKEVKRLASLSCVGRVRHSASNSTDD